MECPIGNKQEILQEPCVTGTSEGWDSSNEKINGKLSKNAWYSTQHNRESGSAMTQKRILKLNINLESIEKRHSDLV